MKIVYAGSPEYAVAPLKALVESGAEIIAVITQPDRPVGRKRVLTPTPVKSYALEQSIPVYDFEKVRLHVSEVAALSADIMITCAYGQILSGEILKAFPMGVYNLHASLLPKFRGASPIQSAILAGERYTGVTVMKTELSLDSGDILLVKRCEVGDKTYGELSDELSLLSAEAALETVELLNEGAPSLLLQDEAAATYCKKICKEQGKVDFNNPCEQVKNLINAFSPTPAAFATLSGTPVNFYRAVVCGGSGAPGRVLSVGKRGVVVACQSGAVCITSLQFAGGKIITAADAANGRKVSVGDVFE